MEVYEARRKLVEAEGSGDRRPARAGEGMGPDIMQKTIQRAWEAGQIEGRKDGERLGERAVVEPGRKEGKGKGR